MSDAHEGHEGKAEAAFTSLRAQGIDVVRVIYSDIIGVDRARDILLDHLPDACGSGLSFCRAVYHTTPQGDVVPVTGGLEAGLPDIGVRLDLDTLHPLPWEPGVAWCLGDAYDHATGRAVPESPRDLLRGVVDWCGRDQRAVVGPELEYYLCEPDTDPASTTGWRPYGPAPGNVYSAGRRGDPDRHLLRTMRHMKELDIGAIAGNHEFSSGQFEINLTHSYALDAADRAFRFKAAVKEIARTEGRMATFMAKPFNDEGGSGFHLHLSLVDADGANVFDAPDEPYGLSKSARYAIAGVLAHAPALAALLNPTVNSYKRFGPDTLAPWLIDWGLDNRSAMVRVPPERGAGARLEMRLGDAAANPYLAVAGTLAAVGLGIRDKQEPPAPLEGYGYGGDAPRLPGTLGEALDALAADTRLGEVLGAAFTDSFLTYKRNEIERFQQFITDWEFREYAVLM
ncbi:glutamine synthetase family protein [Streptomyces sp. NPDC048172]|uniref:glutamine synthetase family protein n=1 Tax=Streptomyces sp. NPDC048172 TaxID=3365505 RepID=UPI003719419F